MPLLNSTWCLQWNEKWQLWSSMSKGVRILVRIVVVAVLNTWRFLFYSHHLVYVYIFECIFTTLEWSNYMCILSYLIDRFILIFNIIICNYLIKIVLIYETELERVHMFHWVWLYSNQDNKYNRIKLIWKMTAIMFNVLWFKIC